MLGHDAYGELSYGPDARAGAYYPGGAPLTNTNAPRDAVGVLASEARDDRRAAERRAGRHP